MAITKIKRKKKTFYYAQIFLNKKRICGKTFDSKVEAEDWHNRELKNLKNPDFKEIKALEEMSFKEAFKRYNREYIDTLNRSSKESYRGRFVYFEKSPLYKLKICQISGKTIDLWLNWLLKHPSARLKKRKSFKTELSILSAFLNWYKNYVDERFNVPIVKRHKDKCAYKSTKPRRPDYFARPEEITAWIEELKKCSNPIYWRLALFMVLTGARVGEACGLLWSEVDLERKFARIVRRTGWDFNNKKPYLEETTKTEASSRILILPNVLAKELKALKQDASNGVVFCNARGELLKYNAIQSAFNKAFKALHLEWRSTHICRHSYATIALMATKNLSAVQASLGHTDQRITQQYAKVIASLSSETAEKTAEMFNFNKNSK